MVIKPTKYIGNGYEVEFNVVNKWPGAFQGELILTNTSDKPLENWTLAFDFEHEITNMWNAQIVTHEANSYIIKNMGHNQDIAPGSSVNIGFQANWNNEIRMPESYDLLIAKQEVGNADYTIGYKVTSDWGQAFNGEIIITCKRIYIYKKNHSITKQPTIEIKLKLIQHMSLLVFFQTEVIQELKLFIIGDISKVSSIYIVCGYADMRKSINVLFIHLNN